MASAFDHARPVWLLLFPWFVWAGTWQGTLALSFRGEPGGRWVACWLGATLLVFCLISAKQPHYLLPLFPVASLVCARGLCAVDTAPARRAWGPGLLPARLALVLLAARCR